MANSENSREIRYLSYQKELELREKEHHLHDDLVSSFLHAYEIYKDLFQETAKKLNFPLISETGELINPSDITLSQLEESCRSMGMCGYEFLEAGQPDLGRKFYKYLPLRHQPRIDSLFEAGLHEELDTIQYHIKDFLSDSGLDLSLLEAIDQGEMEVTFVDAERIAKKLYITAFDLIKYQYILAVGKTIFEYNPKRVFHQLEILNDSDKWKILHFLRYLIQGDLCVTTGELSFIENLVHDCRIKNFDMDKFKQQLLEEVTLDSLETLSKDLSMHQRRQVLGLIINCAYSDKLLKVEEEIRIIQIGRLILGNEVVSPTKSSPGSQEGK